MAMHQTVDTVPCLSPVRLDRPEGGWSLSTPENPLIRKAFLNAQIEWDRAGYRREDLRIDIPRIEAWEMANSGEFGVMISYADLAEIITGDVLTPILYGVAILIDGMPPRKAWKPKRQVKPRPKAADRLRPDRISFDRSYDMPDLPSPAPLILLVLFVVAMILFGTTLGG